MNKIVSFLMVGLFFALFNVATVAAQGVDMPGATDAPPAGITAGQGAAITGSDDVVCGGLPGKLLETNCLRDVLDASKHAVKKAKGQKRGNYGCGNSDRLKHTACLRAILHSSDNTFAPGTN